MPNPKLTTFLDTLLRDQENPDRYFDQYAAFAASLGVDHINLGLTAPRPDGTADVRLWSTMCDGWITEYNEQLLAYDDYVVRKLMPGFKVQGNEVQRLQWHGDELSRSTSVRKPTRYVLAGAAANGMVQAVSFALAGLPAGCPPSLAAKYPGMMVSFGRDARSSRESFDDQLSAHEDLLLTATFALMPRLLASAAEPLESPLSGRERDVLAWLSKGYRAEAIADRLHIARVTVDLHIKHARDKLGARTPTEAVAIAFRLKLLD